MYPNACSRWTVSSMYEEEKTSYPVMHYCVVAAIFLISVNRFNIQQLD